MRRTIKKQFWVTRLESEDLRQKAEAACMAEAHLVRLLIKGYEPRALPDEEFYEMMGQINELTDHIRILELNADGLSNDRKEILEQEIERWHLFQSRIEDKVLDLERRSD